MNEPTVEKYVQQIIELQQDPPRTCSFAGTIKYCYKLTNSRPLLILGVSFIIGMVYLWIVEKIPHKIGSFIGSMILVLGALLMALIPFILGCRIFFLLRKGVIGEAIVVNFTREDSLGFSVYARARQGIVKGNWKVQSQLNTFESSFTTEAMWADDVKEGTKLNVIIHPRKKKVLFVLGLSK